MLDRIKSIKGLAVYEDYVIPNGMIDFKEKNIIYGWNYSGKTTLSRLFSFLEHKAVSPDCQNCTFEIETNNGIVSEKNIAESNLVVRVFNADFINENLNFAGSEAKPILLLGADLDVAQLEIDKSKAKLVRCIKGAEDQAARSANLKKTFDKIKTDAASKIKSTLSIVAAFGSNHLERLIEKIEATNESYLLSRTAYYNDLKLARTADEEKLSPITEPAENYKLTEFTVAAKRLLELKPDSVQAIEKLVKNPKIERWVEEGLELHESETNCQFCGNELDQEILNEFRAHFSRSLIEFRKTLATLINDITSNLVRYSPPKNIEINLLYRTEFMYASENYQLAAHKYNEALLAITEKIKNKMLSPFSEIFIDNIDIGTILNTQNTFVQATEKLLKITKQNNNTTSNFPQLKSEAIERLKLHYAQTFIRDENPKSYARKFKIYANHRARYGTISEALKIKIQELESQISLALPGSNEINKKIEYLLGPNCVQIIPIRVSNEERFQLRRRSGKIAKHLSEGEKTAIAFSFFLTKLGEIENFDEAIIYIDDPISSLDSNHIFQVNSIIKETFFRNDKAKGWTANCKQIFFSTHNFEFLSLLREIQPKFNSSKKSSNYLIRKTTPHKSSFEPMPASMMEYPSEYHFLFEVLHEFHTADDKSDYKVLMLLPNAVRRFVELYTYAKYPSPTDTSVDTRAEKIFGSQQSKRILKVFHFFSHANNIERLMTNSDLMCDVEGAIDDLMTLLEADPTHLEALKAGLKS